MKYRPEYDMELIGRNLRRLREAKHLTVEEVREYLCLGSVQAVYKYEKGKSYPQVDTMFALMELYEADLKDIIYNQEEDLVSSFCFLLIGGCLDLPISEKRCPLLRKISSSAQTLRCWCVLL